MIRIKPDSAAAPAASRLPAKKLVLLVDDDPEMILFLTTLLKAKNYELVSASNGRRAIEYLKKCHRLPDLILLDLEMPEIDGTAFLKIRENDRKLKSIPVIVVSSREEKVPEFLLSPTFFFKKPIMEFERLLEAVRGLSSHADHFQRLKESVSALEYERENKRKWEEAVAAQEAMPPLPLPENMRNKKNFSKLLGNSFR